jgi:hypothetical protein
VRLDNMMLRPHPKNDVRSSPRPERITRYRTHNSCNI